MEKRASQVAVEVHSLSGETLLQADFRLSERVSSVKDKLLSMRGTPLWQQQLVSSQGEMLDDRSTLQETLDRGEFTLPDVVVFNLMLKAGPSANDLQELADVASEAFDESFTSEYTEDIRHVRSWESPYGHCEKVCSAALHILAGLAPNIEVKSDGSPKITDWAGCKSMLGDADFLKQVMQLPFYIEQGRVSEKGMVICRQLIDDIPGKTKSNKEQTVRYHSCSPLLQALTGFLVGTIKYYDCVEELRGRFGGATVTELKSSQ